MPRVAALLLLSLLLPLAVAPGSSHMAGPIALSSVVLFLLPASRGPKSFPGVLGAAGVQGERVGCSAVRSWTAVFPILRVLG